MFVENNKQDLVNVMEHSSVSKLPQSLSHVMEGL
jgi:hypothetical protein